MFDKAKFKYYADKQGITMADIAATLGINIVTLYRKLNRCGDFSRAEIQILLAYLKIENAEEIFFAHKLT